MKDQVSALVELIASGRGGERSLRKHVRWSEEGKEWSEALRVWGRGRGSCVISYSSRHSSRRVAMSLFYH